MVELAKKWHATGQSNEEIKSIAPATVTCLKKS